MKTRMMKSCKLMALRFSERVVFFFFIIASIFHYGQSLSAENPGVYIQEGTVITNNSESVDESAGLDKEANPKITVTGKEHLHISGAIVYGLQGTPADKIKVKADALSQKLQTKIKEQVSRKKSQKR